ncbi:MAG: hypothetical protein JJE17_08825 [Peptostreptococcaceae bacterium]|nr:hypothetical protein [Peptostreptococcaceae bacterium]
MKQKLGHFSGVGFNKQIQKYKVRIRINGVLKYLGCFDNKFDAAMAYDNEVKANGIDRRLNFPEPEPENLIKNTKLIRLTQGKFAIIDSFNYERVNKHKWYAECGYNTFYASRRLVRNGIRGTEKLHRFILNIEDPNILIDHWDRNGLNCTEENMRVATNQQNSQNQIGSKNSTSQYKGVYFNKEKKKYSAQIKVNFKSNHIGHFNSEIEAALAYDLKAKELFGEFAYLNFK